MLHNLFPYLVVLFVVLVGVTISLIKANFKITTLIKTPLFNTTLNIYFSGFAIYMISLFITDQTTKASLTFGGCFSMAATTAYFTAHFFRKGDLIGTIFFSIITVASGLTALYGI